MLKMYLVILVFVLLTSLFTVAYSQLFPPGMEPNKEKAEEKLEMLKIWKLTEVLDLKSEQTIEFFSLYKQFEELRRTHLKERRELVEKLKRDIESGDITQSSIENYNASIIELKKKLIEDESNIINQMSNILTPVQMAKFVVFEETFQEEMLGMIKKMKEEKERFKEKMGGGSEGGPR
jgi:Spy/CpxP family protein refolding chaperone